jgi:hypothetical protein
MGWEYGKTIMKGTNSARALMAVTCSVIAATRNDLEFQTPFPQEVVRMILVESHFWHFLLRTVNAEEGRHWMVVKAVLEPRSFESALLPGTKALATNMQPPEI